MLINAWLIKSRKSAANLTFSKWKQETTGRQKRGKGLTNASQSVIDHQTAMAMTVDQWPSFAAIVKIGYKQSNSTIGNYAAWIRDTMNLAWNFSSPGSPVLSPALIPVAKGSIPPTPMSTTIADQSANTIVVTYPATAGYGQATTDKLYVYAFNEDTGDNYFNTAAAFDRAAGTATFATPSGFLTAGDNVTIVTFFAGMPATITAGKASDARSASVTVVA